MLLKGVHELLEDSVLGFSASKDVWVPLGIEDLLDVADIYRSIVVLV